LYYLQVLFVKKHRLQPTEKRSLELIDENRPSFDPRRLSGRHFRPAWSRARQACSATTAKNAVSWSKRRKNLKLI